MGVAVIVAIAMIMVVVVMTFAREEQRHKLHKAHEENGRPCTKKPLSLKQRDKGHETGERPRAKMNRENPETLKAGIVGASLEVDGEETGEKDGREDQQEARRRRRRR